MSRKHKGSEPAVSDEAVNSVAVASDAGAAQPDNAGMLPDEYRDMVPLPESKADKFRRLANRRVNNAIKAIGYVASLGNRATYEYTETQVDNILQALNEEIAAVKRAFAGNQKKERFSL